MIPRKHTKSGGLDEARGKKHKVGKIGEEGGQKEGKRNRKSGEEREKKEERRKAGEMVERRVGEIYFTFPESLVFYSP